MMRDAPSAHWRRVLETCDIGGARNLWAHVAPHLPQPSGDYDVQVMIHSARTQAESIPLQLRLYSHEWLIANGLLSQLPDRLKPSSEQTHNKFAFGVGIAVLTDDPAKKAAAKVVERAMGAAVEEAFADGRTDTDFLRRRMDEARDRAIRRLAGPQINVRVSHNFSGLPARL